MRRRDLTDAAPQMYNQELCSWPHPLKWFLNQISLKEPGNIFHHLSPCCPSLINVSEFECEGWKRLASAALLVLSLRQNSGKHMQWIVFTSKYFSGETNITCLMTIYYTWNICVATDIVLCWQSASTQYNLNILDSVLISSLSLRRLRW